MVVAGTAKVTIDGDIKLLGENESIYIAWGDVLPKTRENSARFN